MGKDNFVFFGTYAEEFLDPPEPFLFMGMTVMYSVLMATMIRPWILLMAMLRVILMAVRLRVSVAVMLIVPMSTVPGRWGGTPLQSCCDLALGGVTTHYWRTTLSAMVTRTMLFMRHEMPL
jgi:hypothetical protein